MLPNFNNFLFFHCIFNKFITIVMSFVNCTHRCLFYLVESRTYSNEDNRAINIREIRKLFYFLHTLQLVYNDHTEPRLHFYHVCLMYSLFQKYINHIIDFLDTLSFGLYPFEGITPIVSTVK